MYPINYIESGDETGLSASRLSSRLGHSYSFRTHCKQLFDVESPVSVFPPIYDQRVNFTLHLLPI